MNKEEAVQALALLRKVVSQARDDTALENWGIIWMLSAFSNSAGFAATHVLFRRGTAPPWPFVLLWAAVLTVNLVVILAFKARSAGTRSFIEKQIWSIWTTCVLAMGLAAMVNYLVGLSTLFMPPVACIIAAMAFAAMGGLMGSKWYIPAAAWAALSLVIARLPEIQFLVFAAAWFCTQFASGLGLHLAKRRRLATGSVPARLV